jgi:predicted transcriptional regulator
MTVVTVNVNDELDKKMVKFSEMMQCSKSDVIRFALIQYLNKNE